MDRLPDRTRVESLGAGGLRIAHREGTVDMWAIKPWIDLLARSTSESFGRRPTDVILDVGAHIGGFTLLAARLVPDGRVLAIEPCRESHDLLACNVALNGLENVETACVALSDRPGDTYLHYSEAGNWEHTITAPLTAEGERVRTETLAEFLSAHHVEHCDLAKLNCEGGEFPILMSASAATLGKIGQMLVFYHCDLVDERYSLPGLEHHLETAGFEVSTYRKNSSRGRIVARRRC